MRKSKGKRKRKIGGFMENFPYAFESGECPAVQTLARSSNEPETK
jgi:hypothetical protein